MSRLGSTWSRAVSTRGRGFTLIELLLVLTIISLMVGSIVAALHGRRSGHELRLSAEDVAGAIRFASEAARSRHQSYRLAFDERGESFRVETESASAPDGFAAAEGKAGDPRRLAWGVRCSVLPDAAGRSDAAPARTIEFQPDGSGFAGALQVEGPSHDTVRIEVMPGTGQVNVVR